MAKTKKTKAKGEVKTIAGKPVEKYESMKTALTGLSKSAGRKYKIVVPIFCEFVGKNPDQIIAERKQHLKSDDEAVKRTYERRVKEFYEHLTAKKEKGGLEMLEHTAYMYCYSTLRGFFSRNYAKLEYRRNELKKPKVEDRDYIPTLGEIKEIHDAAGIRDMGVIILALQTGMAPVDLISLKRADWEPAIKRGEFPCALSANGWLMREKTKEKFHPFLFRDSAAALKRYLQNRKDSDPHLLVDRSGEPFQERNVNDIFTKAAEKAKITVPKGKRLRIYSLRKVFETQMQNSGMPQPWIDLMMGHEVKGARGAYTIPSEADWLEKARKAESFISVSRVRNMDTLREKINESRQGDMLELMMVLEKELGRDAMKRLSKGYLTLKPLKQMELEDGDLLPPEYVMASVCDEYLTVSKRKFKKQMAPRKRRRGA